MLSTILAKRRARDARRAYEMVRIETLIADNRDRLAEIRRNTEVPCRLCAEIGVSA